MTKPDALAFLTTTKSDFRDFYDTQHGGKVVKEKPDFFTVLKEAELKFQANSSHRADFLNWNSTNGGYDRPKSQRQKKDFFSKAEEDR